MAALTNQIGTHEFIALVGNPDLLREQLEPVIRRGVDGVAVWKIGRRGTPLRLRSQVDCDDLEAGLDTFEEYSAYVGDDAQVLKWNSLDLESYDVQVVVLDVRIVRLAKLALGVGGLSTNQGAWLECDWDLLPIQATE